MSVSAYEGLLRKLRAWPHAPYAVLLHIDLHDMRSLNRSHGPKQTDRLIATAAKVVSDWAGDGGIGARLWSNEFIAVKAIDHAQTAMEEARVLRERLLAMPSPAAWSPSASIGVACAGADPDWAQLLRQAAQGCDKAKQRGINQIAAYAGNSDDRRDQIINIEYVDEFRSLLAAGALTLHPQPIIDISGGGERLAKAEFLMRMEKNGVLMPLPKGMIESLERFGMATELDRFSAAFILGWLEDNGEAMRRLRSVSINLSAKSVADGDFMYKLYNDVRGAHLPHGKLGFEITETTAVEHLDVASDAIAEFRGLGCSFALDDFGSGLCSFGYLQSLPVDEVKIDGRFVRQLAHDKLSREITSAINQVAHATGKKTIAEFVDDRRKLDVLREIGVDYAQGYLFYPAVPPEKLLELLGLGTAIA